MSTNNKLKTIVLLAALTGLFVLVGRALGGTRRMVIALAVMLLMNGASYWFSDRLVLALAHASPIRRDETPPPAELRPAYRARLCRSERGPGQDSLGLTSSAPR